MLGRYPGDVYDGDTDEQAGDHPWAMSTANFAELYYRLASRSRRPGRFRSMPVGQLLQPGRD
jgi:glucoamylase